MHLQAVGVYPTASQAHDVQHMYDAKMSLSCCRFQVQYFLSQLI